MTCGKDLICTNKLMTYDLTYQHIPIDIPHVVQKTLLYMPRGKNMTMSSTLIYYIDIDCLSRVQISLSQTVESLERKNSF